VELPIVRPGEAICAEDMLTDGTSVKFRVAGGERGGEAFLVRFEGRYYAYRNVCAHMALGLDMDDNDFFTIDSRALICKTHGATYQPDTGLCFGGPCYGESLDRLPVIVKDGAVVLDSIP